MRLFKKLITILLTTLLLTANVCVAMSQPHENTSHAHDNSQPHFEQQTIDCCEDTEHQFADRALIRPKVKSEKKENIKIMTLPGHLTETPIRSLLFGEYRITSRSPHLKLKHTITVRRE